MAVKSASPAVADSRSRSKHRGRENDILDYIHERDRLPKPALRHRESSRERGRRHEYRYYEPEEPRRSGAGRPRSQVRRTSDPVLEVPDKHPPARDPDAPRRRDRGRDRSRDRRRDGEPDEHTRQRDRHGRHEADDDRKGVRLDDRDGRRKSQGHGHGQRDGDGTKRKHAAKAALAAGAIEVVRQGAKGSSGRDDQAWKRVATAALGAAAVDAAVSKATGKTYPIGKGKGGLVSASLGGVVMDKLVNKGT